MLGKNARVYQSAYKKCTLIKRNILTNGLKASDGKRYVNTNQKKARVIISLTDKIDFRANKLEYLEYCQG